jgi:hypothetical protein
VTASVYALLTSSSGPTDSSRSRVRESIVAQRT